MTATDGGSPTTGRGTGGRPLGSAYVVHEIIGRGATGEVWRGVDRRTGASVAVKILRAEFADDPRIVERFLRERSMLSELDAPNIVRLRDLVVEGDTVALVTDLVPGGDLRARLRADGTLAPALAVDLTCQILDGLDAAHQHGVIHRDLKPENVLLEAGDAGPVVRVTDFGIATLAYSSASSVTTSIVGSPEYLAPEVIQLGAVTPAVDLYSAGVVLYELLAGRTPFAGGPPIAVVRRQVDDPPPRIPGLPVALWAEVATLLAKDPARRPGRARTAAKRLAELGDELDGLPALTPGLGEPDVVDLVAAEAAEAGNGNGDRDATPPGSEHETTRVRGSRVVDEVVHRAPATPEASTRRAWQRVAPFVAAGVVLAGMGAVWIARRSDAAHASALHYTAAPVLESNGVVVTRTLTLSGRSGDHLAVRLHIENSGKAPLTKVYEPILGSPDHRQTPRSVRLAPEAATTLAYTTKVAPNGLDLAHLGAIETAFDASGGLQNVLMAAHATPGLVQLRPQERAYLNLSGAMRTPSKDDADLHTLLSSIAWSSSDARVADVQQAAGDEWRPVIVASHGGRAVLHADLGTQSLDVEVIVSGKAVAATAGPCEPGVGDPPGLATIPNQTSVASPGYNHVDVIAGGARIPVTDGDAYKRYQFDPSPEQMDDGELGAISTTPRDGTKFIALDTGRVELVVGASVVAISPKEAATLPGTPVKVLQDWISGLPLYGSDKFSPRDGTLVSDFGRTKTERWHDGAWTATTDACPSANVSRLPQNVPLPKPVGP